MNAIEAIVSFLISVAAGFVVNIVHGLFCKWLNSRKK